MPIKPYNPDGLSPEEQLSLRLQRPTAYSANPLEPVAPARPQSESTVGELFAAGLRTNSISGALLGDLGPYAVARSLTPSDVDPSFDIRKFADEKWLADHPYMADDLQSGVLDDIPNERRFNAYMARKWQDFRDREILGQHGFTTQIVASLPGQVLDTITGGLILKAVGAGSSATQVVNWAKSGGAFARIAKGAAIGAGANLAQEQALRAINPYRNVASENEAAAWALGMGAVFGGGVSAIVSGGKYVGDTWSATRIKRMRADVADSLRSPVVADMRKAISDDTQTLQTLIDEAPPQPATRFTDFDAVGGDQTRRYQVLRTPETIPLIEKAKAKFGDRVEFADHPMQASADWLAALDRADRAASEAMPADLGPVANRVSSVMARGIPLVGAEAPGLRMITAPSSLARKAARLFFDFTWPTAETVDAPLTSKLNAPAEGLLWNLHAARDSAIVGMDEALRKGLREGGGFSYTFADGTTAKISSRVWDRRAFLRAATDHLRQLEEARLGYRDEPTAPAPIREAAAGAREYFQAIGRDAADVGYLRELDPETVYVTRRWRTDLIRKDRPATIDRLVREFEYGLVFDPKSRRVLSGGERPVMDGVFSASEPLANRALSDAESSALRELRAASGGALNESKVQAQLGAATLERYRIDLEAYLRRSAERAVDRILGLEQYGGVEHSGGAASVFKDRTLKVRETRFSDLLDNDLDNIIGHYDRATSGKIAARQAIKRSAGEWDSVVREATGKGLAESGYDPALLIQAVKRDFQSLIDSAPDPKTKAALEDAMLNTVGEGRGVLTAKLAELEGRTIFEGNPAATAGWGLFLKRQSLRLPFMAYLGKMTISAIPDLAAGVFYKSLSPERLGTTLRAINLLKEFPRRGLEGLYVATSDIANGVRALELGDVADLSRPSDYGPGIAGSFMRATDSTTDYLQRKFVTLTGMNRWNTNLKRATATMVQGEIIDAAKRIARAADDWERAGGKLTELEGSAKALREAGLSVEDVRRMGRLGMNADRCRRLVSVLSEHGLDWEGNRPWKDAAGFREHRGWVSPEYARWSANDRDLFETMTNAVNIEVQSIIVEPGIASRPLMNATWIGRAINQFQSFASAWGLQTLPMAMQRPGYEVAAYVTLSVGLGAIADAAHNSLSGRRSLASTAEQWKEKPLGMIYGAVNRSNLVGWLSRPLGILEQTPLGIGRRLGNDNISAQNFRPITLTGQLGPFFSWADDALRASQASFSDDTWNEPAKRMAWRSLPFRNLWAIEAFNRAAESAGYGTPIGPEPSSANK